MNLEEAEILAKKLLKQHGLKDWNFGFCRAQCYYGICYFGTKEILLAKNFVLRNNEHHVRNIMIHEIAHAIIGPTHNKHWEQKCIELGGTGKRLEQYVTGESKVILNDIEYKQGDKILLDGYVLVFIEYIRSRPKYKIMLSHGKHYVKVTEEQFILGARKLN
jgi:hypothetical protein